MTTNKKPPGDGPGRFAYEGLDRVIHEKARLSIITSLATHPGGLIFNEPKRELFRETLRKAGFYADWRAKYGEEAWALLERTTGKLG